MKYNKIIVMIAFGTFSMLTNKAVAQDRDDMSKAQLAQRDSLENVSRKEVQAQKTKDDNTMADYKHDRKQTKAKAKDAQRVEREASAAAKESRVAVRTERKAQKSRKQADKQAAKASKARKTSNDN